MRLERSVVAPARVQHKAAAHDVRVAAEDLAEAAHDDVCVRQDLDIDEVAEGLVDDDEEVVLVCELAQPWQVRGAKERVRGELGEEGQDWGPCRCLGLALEERLELVDVLIQPVTEEVASQAPLLEDLEGIRVRESDDDRQSVKWHSLPSSY